MNNIEKSLEIIQRTNDGDDLAPRDLSLCESAVNGFLTEIGQVAFDKLYAAVTASEYVKPWFYGVEHLTQDHEGYVYWKGQHVEHYTFANYDEGKAAAEDLAGRCKYLESIGVKVACGNAIWNWETYLPGPQMMKESA